MNLQENGIKQRLNRYDTFKLNVRARLIAIWEWNYPIAYRYGKKLYKHLKELLEG